MPNGSVVSDMNNYKISLDLISDLHKKLYKEPPNAYSCKVQAQSNILVLKKNVFHFPIHSGSHSKFPIDTPTKNREHFVKDYLRDILAMFAVHQMITGIGFKEDLL